MKASNTIIVSSDQIVRLNAIIHNQREKLRTLNEDKKIIKSENEKLKKKLAISLETLGQIAMFSKDNVDAVQSAKAICDIKELDK